MKMYADIVRLSQQVAQLETRQSSENAFPRVRSEDILPRIRNAFRTEILPPDAFAGVRVDSRWEDPLASISEVAVTEVLRRDVMRELSALRRDLSLRSSTAEVSSSSNDGVFVGTNAPGDAFSRELSELRRELAHFVRVPILAPKFDGEAPGTVPSAARVGAVAPVNVLVSDIVPVKAPMNVLVPEKVSMDVLVPEKMTIQAARSSAGVYQPGGITSVTRSSRHTSSGVSPHGRNPYPMVRQGQERYVSFLPSLYFHGFHYPLCFRWNALSIFLTRGSHMIPTAIIRSIPVLAHNVIALGKLTVLFPLKFMGTSQDIHHPRYLYKEDYLLHNLVAEITKRQVVLCLRSSIV